MALFHSRRGNATRRNNSSTSGKTTGTSPVQRTSVLASASLVTKRQIRSSTKRESWQDEAWAMFDQCGELHATVRWLGNAMSRVQLYIAKAEPESGGDPQPADHPPDAATNVLTELMSGSTGQGEMLRRIATNLEVVGEVYFVRLPKDVDPTVEGPQEPDYRWIVASTDEFSHAGGHSRVTLPESGEKVAIDPDTTTIIRLWSPHPRVSWEPDSQVRANLPALREVMKLSQHITATVESRLAGAGVLAIPKSATMPNPNTEEGANPLHHNGFVDALVQGMVTPITDRDNAAAVVPIVISVDDEAIGKLQHLTFATELDNRVTEMRNAALQRYAAGCDLPQEVVLGLGDSTNHWSSAEIEDMAIKLSVEPMCGVICDALTQHLLRPALRAMGEDDPESWAIWYDTSELTQRPDRSAEAQALYDKGVLSPESLLRENGFQPDDMPTDEEKREEFARQVVLAKPELIAPLAPFVGFEGLEDELQQSVTPEPGPGAGGSGGSGGSGGGAVGPGGQQKAIGPGGGQGGQPSNGSGGGQQQQRPNGGQGGQPSGGQRPGGSPAPPSQRNGGNRTAALDSIPAPRGELTTADDADEDQWRIAAIELVTLRALELAGKRLLTNAPRGVRGKPGADQVHAWDLHTIPPEPPRNLDKLMAGAFDLSDPVVGLQPCVQQAVDTYCRTLLTTQRPHRREYLVDALRHAGCLP